MFPLFEDPVIIPCYYEIYSEFLFRDLLRVFECVFGYYEILLRVSSVSYEFLLRGLLREG